MGADPIWVPRESRALYHAALSFGANNVMTLVNQTVDLLAGAGIEQPTDLIAPLFSAALDNALRDGDLSMTGPVIRGDVATVAQHLSVLSGQDPAVVQTYRALARLTASRALESGQLSAQQAEKLLEVLADD
jgi:hypothetical protein